MTDLDAIEARHRQADPHMVSKAPHGAAVAAHADRAALTAEVRKLREALASADRAANGSGPTAHRMLAVKQILDESLGAQS